MLKQVVLLKNVLKDNRNNGGVLFLGICFLVIGGWVVWESEDPTPEMCFETKIITQSEAKDLCLTYEKSLKREEEKMRPQSLGCDGGVCYALPPERTKPVRRHGLIDIKQKYSCKQKGDVIEIVKYLRDKEGCGAYVVIPNTIDGKEVVGIGKGAFALSWKKKKDDKYLKLETLKLPRGLVWVDDEGFPSNLLTGVLKLPSKLKYIGDWGFGNNEFSEVRFNDGLEYIGNDAFRNNNIKEVKFPVNVFFIGTRAFLENDIEAVEMPSEIDNEELRIPDPKEVFDKSVDVKRN